MEKTIKVVSYLVTEVVGGDEFKPIEVFTTKPSDPPHAEEQALRNAINLYKKHIEQDPETKIRIMRSEQKTKHQDATNMAKTICEESPDDAADDFLLTSFLRYKANIELLDVERQAEKDKNLGLKRAIDTFTFHTTRIMAAGELLISTEKHPVFGHKPIHERLVKTAKRWMAKLEEVAESRNQQG